MKRRYLQRFVTTSVVAAGLLASSPAMAATKIYLKLDGVTGEATDTGHKGEISVLAWSWGESTGTAQTRRGPVPAACIQDLTVTKNVDSSSPALIMDGMIGQVIPTAVLVLERSAVGGPQDFLTLTMKNVTVAAFQTGGSEGADGVFESVTLHFDSMQGQYQPQLQNGSLGNPITWDIFERHSRGCQ